MNRYRVDRHNLPVTPAGMNSIVYIGENWLYAQAMYANTATGLDIWDKPDPTFGVILSVWDDQQRDYRVLKTKGITAPVPAPRKE